MILMIYIYIILDIKVEKQDVYRSNQMRSIIIQILEEKLRRFLAIHP